VGKGAIFTRRKSSKKGGENKRNALMQNGGKPGPEPKRCAFISGTGRRRGREERKPKTLCKRKVRREGRSKKKKTETRLSRKRCLTEPQEGGGIKM